MDNLTRKIAAILFSHDPMIINFGENVGEYNLEAQTIVGLLKVDSSQKDIVKILDVVMSKWFGKNWAKINSKTTKKEKLARLSADIYKANLQ